MMTVVGQQMKFLRPLMGDSRRDTCVMKQLGSNGEKLFGIVKDTGKYKWQCRSG